MSKRALVVVILAMATGATPVLAEGPEQTGVVSEYQRVPKFKDEKVVCRKVAQTGTRITREVCTTQKQRDADRTGAQKFLDDFTRNATIQKQTAG